MNHTIYILKSKIKENWSYVGSTSNMQQRFLDHSRGGVKSTKGLRPLYIVYTEQSETREKAYKRELYLKSGIGREEKQRIIKYSEIV